MSLIRLRPVSSPDPVALLLEGIAPRLPEYRR